jgi:hypothetical protein
MSKQAMHLVVLSFPIVASQSRDHHVHIEAVPLYAAPTRK